MKLKLFEYVVLKHPKKNKDGDYKGDTKLLIKPTTMLAPSEQDATFKIVRLLSEDDIEDLSRIDIVIRAF